MGENLRRPFCFCGGLGEEAVIFSGASGAGVSTLGKAVTRVLDITWVDVDDHFWVKTDPPFAEKRAPQQRMSSMEKSLGTGCWVLSGSCPNWGDEVTQAAQIFVFVSLQNEIRMQRLLERERARFGDRIDPSGDLHETNIGFMSWAASYEDPSFSGRSRAQHECWMAAQVAPILRVDSAAALDDLVVEVLEAIWTCHGLVPLRVLNYAAIRSKANGLFQPNAECLRRGL